MGRFGPQWAKNSQIGPRHNIVNYFPAKTHQRYPRSIEASRAVDFAWSAAASQGIFRRTTGRRRSTKTRLGLGWRGKKENPTRRRFAIPQRSCCASSLKRIYFPHLVKTIGSHLEPQQVLSDQAQCHPGITPKARCSSCMRSPSHKRGTSKSTPACLCQRPPGRPVFVLKSLPCDPAAYGRALGPQPTRRS